MNINKLNLLISKCAGKGESRYHLETIHFTKDYTEATNRHILGGITHPTQYPIDELPTMLKSDDKEKLNEFCIPVNGVKDIKFPKKINYLPLLNDVYIDVEHTNNNNTAKFMSTNLETTPVTEIRKLDGEFPETDGIWPEDKDAIFEINVDGHYLSIMGEIAASFSNNHGCNLTFYKGESAPMKIRAHSSNTGQEFTGLIMPMRGDARDFSDKDKKED